MQPICCMVSVLGPWARGPGRVAASMLASTWPGARGLGRGLGAGGSGPGPAAPGRGRGPGARVWPGARAGGRGLGAGGLGLGPSYLFGPSMTVNGVVFLTQIPPAQPHREQRARELCARKPREQRAREHCALPGALCAAPRGAPGSLRGSAPGPEHVSIVLHLLMLLSVCVSLCYMR